MAEERTFQIRAGMEVVDTAGAPLGTLQSILTETKSGVSRFLTVERRILPVEAIDGVDGDTIKMTVDKERFGAFPERPEGQLPSEDQLRQAYEVLGIAPGGNPPAP